VKIVGRNLAFINEDANNQTLNKQAVSMHRHVVEVRGKNHCKILGVSTGGCYAFHVAGQSFSCAKVKLK
jgi:hypothetical protein